jgi:hypothetical protein
VFLTTINSAVCAGFKPCALSIICCTYVDICILSYDIVQYDTASPYSSVVEHPLSKRKVRSSILRGGIILFHSLVQVTRLTQLIAILPLSVLPRKCSSQMIRLINSLYLSTHYLTLIKMKPSGCVSRLSLLSLRQGISKGIQW